MIRHGEPPYLECSTRGDRRFSAFVARVRGKSIERWYQEAKVFDDDIQLEWRDRKGLKPLNPEECAELYSRLWDEYIANNQHLVEVLVNASGLSDMFGKEGSVCQATELWRIRKEYLGRE